VEAESRSGKRKWKAEAEAEVESARGGGVLWGCRLCPALRPELAPQSVITPPARGLGAGKAAEAAVGGGRGCGWCGGGGLGIWWVKALPGPQAGTR
jgi:hypothetical protein